VRVSAVCLGDPGGRHRTGEPERTWDGAVVALALRGEPEHMGESEGAGAGARAALSESASLLPAQSVLRVLTPGLLGLSLFLRDASGEQGREPWRRSRTGEPLRSLSARSCSPARAPRSTGDGPSAASTGGGEGERIDQASTHPGLGTAFARLSTSKDQIRMETKREDTKKTKLEPPYYY
jgi:hypothetical protein